MSDQSLVLKPVRASFAWVTAVLIWIGVGHFVSELKSRFPQQRFLIVHFGDHHPSVTRTLVGYQDDVNVGAIKVDAESLAFQTYFAVDGINYTVPPLPNHDIVDVPYLGLIIQEAAGLPLSEATQERKRLMALCHGLHDSCAKREEILAFHRRLIDSGIIIAW